MATISGTRNNDRLFGTAVADFIDGREGDDVLDGKAGSDVLQGGLGGDWFVFSTALDSGNVDRILDFDSASDGIAIDDSVFVGLASGALGAGAFALGAAAQDADDRIIYNKETGDLLFDSDGLGGAEAVVFATLQPNLDVNAGDFIVF